MKIKLTILALLLMVTFVSWVGLQHPHNQRVPKECKVLSKMNSGPDYKVSARWILVLENKGRVFDLDVSPSTYWKVREGETVTFNIKEEQIVHSSMAVAIWMLSVIGMTFGIMFSLVSIVWIVGPLKSR